MDCSTQGLPVHPTPGVCSNSCPLSWWCHPTVSSSVVPFLLPPSIFPSIRVFSNESILPIRCSYTVQKKFLYCCKSAGTHNRFLNLGIWQRDWEPPGNLTLEAVGFDYRTSTALREQTLGGHKQILWETRTQEKGAVTPQETEPDFPVSVQESPAEIWLHSDLWWGQKHWIQQSWELWLAVIIPWKRSPLPPLPLPYFDLRTNYKEGTQPH